MAEESWLTRFCTPEETGPSIPDLYRQEVTFPSLDQLHEARAGVPRLRDIQAALDSGWGNFILTRGDGIETAFVPLLRLLVWTEQLMLWVPWWAMLAILTAIVWGLTRSVRLSVGVLVTLIVIGFLGMWTETIQTLSFISVCTATCFIAIS
jgi:ABC-type proline/glycine betaine transport system permease subunit